MMIYISSCNSEWIYLSYDNAWLKHRNYAFSEYHNYDSSLFIDKKGNHTSFFSMPNQFFQEERYKLFNLGEIMAI